MKLLQIHKNKDGSCTVNSWSNADGSMDTVTYTSIEAATKINPLLSKTIHGLSSDADFSSIWFNPDGSELKADYQLSPATKSDPIQTAIIDGAALAPVKSTLDTLKTDLSVKVAAADDQVDNIKP